jgi:hypothetical protein
MHWTWFSFSKQRKACHVNCHCDQPNNWKDRIISLTDLKEVKIDGFNGEDHEVGLLKVLLRCAALLQSVTMNLSRNVSRRRSCSAYMELPSLLKAHPSVKFNIDSWCGDQVLFGWLECSSKGNKGMLCWNCNVCFYHSWCLNVAELDCY